MSPDILRELSLLLRPAGGGLYLVSTGRAEQQALQRRFYDADSEADVTERFLATLARLADARVVLLGVPSDVGAGFRRGANLGPQAIRTRLLDADPAFIDYCKANRIVDAGDVFVVPQLLDDRMLSPEQRERSRRALYPDVAATERERLPVSPLSIAERALALILRAAPTAKPMLLGGDHSCAWPAVKAMHDAGRRFCIVQPDAHTDLLAERLGIEMCFATWTYHANELVGRNQRVIEVGVRASQRPREHWEQTLGVRQFWADEIREAPEQALDRVIEAAKATGLPAYLSNDIDGTDAAIADACGTPEPGGLEPAWVRELIRRLGSEVGLVGGDVMEVAPGLGHDGGVKTVALAADYVRDTLEALLVATSGAQDTCPEHARAPRQQP
jgi:agmatinase